jgi:hypothetical protein
MEWLLADVDYFVYVPVFVDCEVHVLEAQFYVDGLVAVHIFVLVSMAKDIVLVAAVV